MGCGPSYRHCYTDIPETAQWRNTFQTLTFSERDVGRMMKIFRKIDVDLSGEIQIIELLNYLDIDRNEFTKRVFGIFDEDGSGQIDFREFVVSLWNYCTLEHSTLGT
jgi:Ca2+-binding EF-hand superfamily protein